MRILPILSNRAISVACCPPAIENDASVRSQSNPDQFDNIGRVPPPKLARLQGMNKISNHDGTTPCEDVLTHASTARVPSPLSAIE